MRDIPARLAEALDAPLSALAYLWRVQRRDGVALGFTSHDRALLVGGLHYEPAPGIRPFAISESAGHEDESGDVSGALSSDRISEADLVNGRFDGAAVEMRLVDWTRLEAGSFMLTSGTLGEVSIAGGVFEAELQTPEAKLLRVPIETTSPECRAAFGDRRCQVDLSRHRRRVRVVSVDEEGRVYFAGGLTGGDYAYGRLRMLSGALAGQNVALARSGPEWAEPSDGTLGISAGDEAELTAGCDKRWSTCRDRFRNQANFRGEPFAPGRDSMLRYPGL